MAVRGPGCIGDLVMVTVEGSAERSAERREFAAAVETCW
jgi:hypothetical protein